MALLLFDLDGTLLLTGGAGMRAMNRAGKVLFGDRFSFDGVEVSGGLDPQLFTEAAFRFGVRNPSAHHDSFRRLYLEMLREELAVAPERVAPLPGVLRLLDTLRSNANLTVGLLTGNYRDAAPHKLNAAGIDPLFFRIAVFGDDAVDRRAMVALAIARHEAAIAASIDRRQVIIIGDTPRDIDCAHANGALCLAVATGRYTVQELIDAGADATAEDLTDSTPLFSLLNY
jgi:phosphoglycolate phosphatase-like HAD superfamily hydrolase